MQKGCWPDVCQALNFLLAIAGHTAGVCVRVCMCAPLCMCLLVRVSQIKEMLKYYKASVSDFIISVSSVYENPLPPQF